MRLIYLILYSSYHHETFHLFENASEILKHCDRIIRSIAWSFHLSFLMRAVSRSERLDIKARLPVLNHLVAAKLWRNETFLSPRVILMLIQDQRRRGVITSTECRTFIRALFCYGPKLGVPVTVVVPYGSEIQRQMWSQPGKIIVSCGTNINEVIEVKSMSKVLN